MKYNTISEEEMQRQIKEYQRRLREGENATPPVSVPEKGSRVFRDSPFAWFEKSASRKLRRKYKDDKHLLSKLKVVYISLCEIDSDFAGRPILGFMKTVGTYSGISRERVSKYVRLLEEERLIKIHRQSRGEDGKFQSGQVLEILPVR